MKTDKSKDKQKAPTGIRSSALLDDSERFIRIDRQWREAWHRKIARIGSGSLPKTSSETLGCEVHPQRPFARMTAGTSSTSLFGRVAVWLQSLRRVIWPTPPERFWRILLGLDSVSLRTKSSNDELTDAGPETDESQKRQSRHSVQ